jgi:hypothetical protein
LVRRSGGQLTAIDLIVLGRRVQKGARNEQACGSSAGTQLTFDTAAPRACPPADPEKLLRGIRAGCCGEACEQATRRAAADGRRYVEPAGGCEPHHRGDDGHRLSGVGAAGWATAGRSDRRDAGASPLATTNISILNAPYMHPRECCAATLTSMLKAAPGQLQSKVLRAIKDLPLVSSPFISDTPLSMLRMSKEMP